MSRKVLEEKNCDYSINTFVHLGKTKDEVPKGWALKLEDIKDFIPVLRYEFECYIQINDVISPCRLKINPRLFYRGAPLREHLAAQRLIDKERPIPLELKFNKKELDKSLDEFDKGNLDYIDTKLTVGKSYSSKGWGLSKEVVSKIFPLDVYNYLFPVYIDGIPAETRLNLQSRLFYSSKELSQELERLNKIDPKQKVNARIILNEDYLHVLNSIKKENKSDRKCVICGKILDNDGESIKCFECLDKELTVLKLKKVLEYFSPLETFYEEDLLKLGYTKGQVKIFVYKFKKNDLIAINWDESYQLMDKSVLDNFIKQWG
nr:hypothetical protein [uncultured Methanobrevibacter sp.]